MSGHLVIGGQLGSYMIESVIGRGGMSVVYRATHSRLGTPVALKVLAPELSSDDAFRERFLREAKMAAGIDHPNVIPIYDTGLHEDSLYIVMRYVGGGDFKALLVNSGPLSAQRAVELLRPVARALDVAHSHGLVHRDVKPANILLQRSQSGDVEHVYLSDFGVTKHASSVSGLTKTGALVGTIDYMAPEQIEGRDVSAQTDVYALGCLFYQSVTGRVPHQRESEAAALWAHMREEVEPASKIRPDLPASVDGAIARALAKNPSARFATCDEFIQAAGAAGPVRASRPSSDLPVPAGATVAEPEPSAQETAWPGLERSPDLTTGTGREPTGAASPPPPARAASNGRGRSGPGAWLARRWWVAGLVVLVGGAVAAAIALTSGGSESSSSTKAGDKFPATLAGVPTNHVAGTGSAVIKLSGNAATMTVDTNGLLGGAPHAMHIHAGGQGRCPTAQAAHQHNGRLSINTVNGEPFYGPPVTSMTTKGDTSKESILAFPRYPNVGDIRYSRTITLPRKVVADIRNRKASVIVHGIDYNENGLYDSVLDRSELDRHLPGEATAPALCGPLVASGKQKASAGGSRTYTAALIRTTDAGWFCAVPGAPSTAAARSATAGI
jgi:serine/threonine protein kinase